MSNNHFPLEIVALGDHLAALAPNAAGLLVRYLEQSHGIKATVTAEPIEPRPPLPPPPGERRFDVRLDGFDPVRKVEAIKTIRELLTLGIKEAKTFVESCPVAVGTGLDEATATPLRARLEAAGFRVSLVESVISA